MELSFLGFMVLWVAFFLAFGLIFLAPSRLAAWLTRPLHARFFPLTHRIARSMERDRDDWFYDRTQLVITHEPSGLRLYVGLGGPMTIRVMTTAGYWEPSPVERRILASAFERLTREAALRAADLHMSDDDEPPAQSRFRLGSN